MGRQDEPCICEFKGRQVKNTQHMRMHGTCVRAHRWATRYTQNAHVTRYTHSTLELQFCGVIHAVYTQILPKDPEDTFEAL